MDFYTRAKTQAADLDLVILPTTRTVDVNLDSPNIATSWAK
jgi:hypothetical protein